MKKDQIVEVIIEDMSEEGAGIGKFDGYPLFIKDTVIGDRVRAKIVKEKKTYGFAIPTEIIEPSTDRVVPLCPAAGPCGGCQLQAMGYEAQLAFKRRKVAEHLRRIGGFVIAEDADGEGIFVEPALGMEDPWRYRNKAQYPVGTGKDGRIRMGFYAGRTHSIIETEDCLLADAVCAEILRLVRAWMEKFSIPAYDEEKNRGLVRHVLIRTAKDGGIMVCLVINGKNLPESGELADELFTVRGMKSLSFNVNTERGNVILGRDVVPVRGKLYLEDMIGDMRYRISPMSFFQINKNQTEKLYNLVLDAAALTGGETVWDLYCGIGTISLYLAKAAAQVKGVEIVPAAVENARENAELNGIKNAEFFLGRAEEVLPNLYKECEAKGKRPEADVIVVDPPRKGCGEELLRTMINMAPDRIVYVSCDSATLARDLKILCSGGYSIKRVTPVDMFPQSIHVETVVLMSRVKD